MQIRINQCLLEPMTFEMHALKRIKLKVLGIGLMLALLSACTTFSHYFEFDARWDSPREEVLDFRYGDSKIGGTYFSGSLKNMGLFVSWTRVYGTIQKPDFLYVKWRIKSTGEVYEDTVDLRSRLPFNMAEQRSDIGQPDHPDRKYRQGIADSA